MNRVWEDKAKAKRVAPHVHKLTDLFNRVAMFVTSEILYCPSELTSKAITFYIRVRKEF